MGPCGEGGHGVPPKAFEEERVTGARPIVCVGQMAETRGWRPVEVIVTVPIRPTPDRPCHDVVIEPPLWCFLSVDCATTCLSSDSKLKRIQAGPLLYPWFSKGSQHLGVLWIWRAGLGVRDAEHKGAGQQSVTCKSRRKSCQSLFIESLSNSPSCLVFSQP